jgi:molybdopterin molybdotransferase
LYDERWMTADVRMVGFARRTTVDTAIAWIDAQSRRPLDAELVTLREAAGRVLAAAIVSAVDVPGFDRATMDGYAVVADSTEGASPYNRITLAILGEVLPGVPFDGAISAGQAVRIMTGAPMPRGANAVLPAEWTEPLDARTIAVTASVSPSKHVGARGEDITSGTVVLPAGRSLRPQDLGVASSIGMGEVPVVRRPVVRLLITGNELLPSGTAPPGQRPGAGPARSWR